jgi:hypothetical protein
MTGLLIITINRDCIGGLSAGGATLSLSSCGSDCLGRRRVTDVCHSRDMCDQTDPLSPVLRMLGAAVRDMCRLMLVWLLTGTPMLTSAVAARLPRAVLIIDESDPSSGAPTTFSRHTASNAGRFCTTHPGLRRDAGFQAILRT